MHEKELIEADPQRLARALGLHERAGRYFCPFCQRAGPSQHTTPDLSCHLGGWRCWKCGWKGGGLQLVQDALQLPFLEVMAFVRKSYGMSDGMPIAEIKAKVRAAKVKLKRPKKEWGTLDEGVQYVLRSLGGVWSETHRWYYSDDLVQIRFDSPGEKTYRPFHRRGGWFRGLPDGLLPLYRGEESRAAVLRWGPCPERAVAIVEGEKTADAAWSMGMPAVCSMGGSSNPERGDWSVLEGREWAIILPDNDKAGQRYAQKVKHILDGMQIPACIINIGGMPEGGDLCDLLTSKGQIGAKEILCQHL